jgi:hypothetical protein
MPMLDFHCPSSATDLSIVTGVLHRLGTTGFLSDSGKSFHFYSDLLFDWGEADCVCGARSSSLHS